MRESVIASLAALVMGAGGSGGSPTQVGQTAGGIAGSFLAPGIGSTVGALVGTLAGMVVEEQVDKAREQKERVDLGHELATSPMSTAAAAGGLLMGQPTRVWVDEQVQNGRLIVGHFEVRPVS